MSELIEHPAYLAPAEPRQPTEWQTDDDVRIDILSHFGAPYVEGDTPLFI